MAKDHSVTQWLRDLRDGRAGASTRIWNHYYARVVRLVARRVRSVPRRSWDEEDVAVEVFQSFFDRLRRGQFPHLDGRGPLWRLLVTMARRKASNQLRKHGRRCRGGHLRLIGESEFGTTRSLQELCPDHRSHQDLCSDQVAEALAVLRRPDLIEIASGKLSGATNAEIAARVRRSIPTVERRWRLIRETWRMEGLG